MLNLLQTVLLAVLELVSELPIAEPYIELAELHKPLNN
nr:MAG TPA: hypothetical protein [Caudoviricetes sp.]